jgi:hypothetical protein
MTEDGYEKAMQECIKTPLDPKKLEALYADLVEQEYERAMRFELGLIRP